MADIQYQHILYENSSIYSSSKRFEMFLQDDGNLVVYLLEPDGVTRVKAIWYSNSLNSTAFSFINAIDKFKGKPGENASNNTFNLNLALDNSGNLVMIGNVFAETIKSGALQPFYVVNPLHVPKVSYQFNPASTISGDYSFSFNNDGSFSVSPQGTGASKWTSDSGIKITNFLNVTYGKYTSKKPGVPSLSSVYHFPNTTSVTQPSMGGQEITVSHTIQKNWSQSMSIGISSSTEVTVEDPEIGLKASETVTASANSTKTQGGQSSETITFTFEPTVTVPANTTYYVWVEVTQSEITVPYTGTIEIDVNGESITTTMTGIYSGSYIENGNPNYVFKQIISSSSDPKDKSSIVSSNLITPS